MRKRITELHLTSFLSAPRYFLIYLDKICSKEVEQAFDLLDCEDIKQAMRLVFQKDRERYLLTYAITKIILGEVLESAPRNLIFLRGKFGKPYLPEHSLQFNLSHSGNYAFLGLHPTRSIGVDIEKCHDSASLLDGVDTFLFPEEKKWLFNKHPSPQEGIFILWLAKESYLKALGLGFSKSIPILEPTFADFQQGLTCFNAHLSKEFPTSSVKVYDKVISDYKLSTCLI